MAKFTLPSSIKTNSQQYGLTSDTAAHHPYAIPSDATVLKSPTRHLTQ